MHVGFPERDYFSIDNWKKTITSFYEHKVPVDVLYQWQSGALKQVLTHVHQYSPFYRKRLSGYDLESITLDTLSSLPFTTKSDLASEMYSIICGDIRDGIYFCSTTGTTGRPTPCPRNLLDFEVDNTAITLSLGEIVREWLPPGEKPVLAMLGPNEMHSVCLSISSAAKELNILKMDVFPLSPVIGFKRLFELLQELKVNVIVGSPGLLMALAEMSVAYGIDVKDDLFIKCALCCGELCTPQMTKLIESTWGARSCNWWYGQQEIGTSHVAKHDGSFLSLRSHYIIELIDPKTNQPVQGNGRGEMCLTSLVPGMKPLIRYRTGDFVELNASPGDRPIIRMLGRVKDMVTINGIPRSAAEIEAAILGDQALVFGYQLEMRQHAGKDSALIRVKAKENADLNSLKAAIAIRFGEHFGVVAEVEILPLLDLVTATGGWITWKTARIKDTRNAEVVEIEKASAEHLARLAARSI